MAPVTLARRISVLTVLASLAAGAAPAAAQSPTGPPAATPRLTGRATQVIQAAIDAYRAAPGLTDTAVIRSVKNGTEGDVVRIEYALGAGTDARIRTTEVEAAAVGPFVFVARTETPSKYLEVPLQTALDLTLERVARGAVPMPPAFAFRRGATPEACLDALGMGLLRNARVTSTSRLRQNGAELQQLTLAGLNGTAVAEFASDTRMLTNLRLEVTPPGASADTKVSAIISFTPRIARTSITFDPKGRTRVTEPSRLAPAPPAVGDTAPDFSLEQLGADPIAMAELRGSVVILDFWATWCGPCKRALPELQSFHTWAKASGQPIRVFAVNTGERSRPDQTRANVSAYWTSQNYTIPVLFDLDKSLARAYGLSSIPYTVVIGPEGVIRHVHRGYTAGLDARLQAQVAALLDR